MATVSTTRDNVPASSRSWCLRPGSSEFSGSTPSNLFDASGYIGVCTSTFPEPNEESPWPSVTVVWSPGVGRGLARRLIEGEGLLTLGARAGEASVTNHCAVCGSSEHGRPALTPLQGRITPLVSISYAADLTVVALTDAGRVGVDVERIDATESFTRFDAVVTHEDERTTEMRSRTVTWVRKESLLKATGLGLRVDPRQIRLVGAR